MLSSILFRMNLLKCKGDLWKESIHGEANTLSQQLLSYNQLRILALSSFVRKSSLSALPFLSQNGSIPIDFILVFQKLIVALELVGVWVPICQIHEVLDKFLIFVFQDHDVAVDLIIFWNPWQQKTFTNTLSSEKHRKDKKSTYICFPQKSNIRDQHRKLKSEKVKKRCMTQVLYSGLQCNCHIYFLDRRCSVFANEYILYFSVLFLSLPLFFFNVMTF